MSGWPHRLATRLGVYRRAAPASTARNLLKTLGQTAAFWAVFLGLAPHWIARHDPLPPLDLPLAWRLTLALILFAAFGALGLHSGVTMARLGHGTPLPLDGPRVLVIAGPYAYVRNPMAIAGIGQAIAVGIGLGSWAVVVYALTGALLWNTVVRPSEEEDLEATFGAAYLRYRARVRCWWPRRRRYDPR